MSGRPPAPRGSRLAARRSPRDGRAHANDRATRRRWRDPASCESCAHASRARRPAPGARPQPPSPSRAITRRLRALSDRSRARRTAPSLPRVRPAISDVLLEVRQRLVPALGDLAGRPRHELRGEPRLRRLESARRGRVDDRRAEIGQERWRRGLVARRVRDGRRAGAREPRKNGLQRVVHANGRRAVGPRAGARSSAGSASSSSAGIPATRSLGLTGSPWSARASSSTGTFASKGSVPVAIW